MHIFLFRLAVVFGALLVGSAPAKAAQGARPSTAEIFFKLTNPCPGTTDAQGACKGYVVDRVIPLVCGGADDPSNMKWLTLAEANEKKKWERIGCRPGRKLVLPGQAQVEIEAFALKGPVEPVEAKPLLPGSPAPAVRPKPVIAEEPAEENEE